MTLVPRWLRRRCVLGAWAARGERRPARAEDDFLDPGKAFQFTAQRALDGEDGRGELRDRARATTSTASSSSSPPPAPTLGTPTSRPARSSTTRPSRRTSRPTATACTSACRCSRPGPVPARRQPPGLRRQGPVLSADAERADVSLAGFGGDGTCARRARPRRRWPARRRRRRRRVATPPRRRSRRAHRSRAARAAFWQIVGVFFLAGVLLSLTPCVLPMLPILSSIIVGQGGAPPCRAARLRAAASYSLGMALVYTALGVAAGLAGEGLAAACRTRGCSAPSRSAWSRSRCRCSASTSCSCRQRHQLR